MPGLTWVEDKESRSATIYRLGKKSASTYSVSFKVLGTTNDLVVHAEANDKFSNQFAYWQYPGQPSVSLRCESYTVDYLGGDAWSVKASYEKVGADDDTQTAPLKRSRSFDTSGGTSHMTQCHDWDNGGETKYAASGETAPDQFGAIGVDGNSVNGVDVIAPALNWTESYDVPSNYVSAAYIRRIAGMTGTTNSASFRGFATGEVLFGGAQGSHEWDDQKGYGCWTLNYKFIASQNADGTATGAPKLKFGDITDIQKKGHEYIWCRYSSTSGSDNILTQKPQYVYVNRVYRSTNFSNLGIGTT